MQQGLVCDNTGFKVPGHGADAGSRAGYKTQSDGVVQHVVVEERYVEEDEIVAEGKVPGFGTVAGVVGS